MSIEEFAEKYIREHQEAVYKGNCDALEKLEDSNVLLYDLAQGQEPVCVGWEAHKQHILGIRQALSGIQSESKYLTGEGDLFAFSYKMSGIFTGEIPGMPPSTGKEVTSNYLCLYRVKNGKVIEGWSHGTITGLT
jgi:predicted ester cyclase